MHHMLENGGHSDAVDQRLVNAEWWSKDRERTKWLGRTNTVVELRDKVGSDFQIKDRVDLVRKFLEMCVDESFQIATNL
jgi:hypothetical protein